MYDKKMMMLGPRMRTYEDTTPYPLERDDDTRANWQLLHSSIASCRGCISGSHNCREKMCDKDRNHALNYCGLSLANTVKTKLRLHNNRSPLLTFLQLICKSSIPRLLQTQSQNLDHSATHKMLSTDLKHHYP